MHVAFLRSALRRNLPSGFVQLDASRPWIIFWIVHALDLLGKPAPTSANPDRRRIVQTLARCQHPEGGFGGGPGQLPHLATTYAAVHALAVVGGSEAYDCIDRENMLRFLLSMKQEDGSFRMFDGGEIDVRGSYCAMTVARLLNILVPELTANVAAFVASCQTWEGGIGSVPGLEAHGGYAFCGLAACEVLRDTDAIDVDRLVEWAAARQMAVEGGFQGRTNKLVDGCYSLWQGALFQILGAVLARRDCAGVVPTREVDAKVDCLMNRFALQEYILACCQDPVGGLLDKPEKNPDYYHTCYCLSGLSVAQHQYRWEGSKLDFTVDDALFVLGDPTTNAVVLCFVRCRFAFCKTDWLRRPTKSCF
ncbi:terpenoid cyclases/protein prenyltransferase alpha-alpha toroid [Zopfochytrium polystomum]|nr:terpenoid cyclases/protein prenyltransferase alpha-alpha toroid [Zopfochytrium polystomum]